MDILSDYKYLKLIKKKKLNDDDYLKLITLLSTYDIRIVEDKIYQIPKFSIKTINDLYIEGLIEGYDICDLILIYDFIDRTNSKGLKSLMIK
jgi:hypothetical protein